MTTEKRTTKIEPGSPQHFALLGAPYNFNFLTGKDWQDMQAFARSVWIAALASAQAQQEPFWFAVISRRAPVINKAIRSEEVANEYADRQRELWPDVEVVPLYRTAPPVQHGPMGREGCNYMCMPGKVCRKCGHVHDIPLTDQPVQQAIRPAPCPDIKGYVSGGGLDHVMNKVRAGAVPNGWKLVPVEPTREMLDAYVAQDARFQSARTDWHAMLNAAPPAPAAVVKQSLTTPEKREPLAVSKIFEIAEDLMIPGSDRHVMDFARAIERAHGIGITPADAKEGIK